MPYTDSTLVLFRIRANKKNKHTSRYGGNSNDDEVMRQARLLLAQLGYRGFMIQNACRGFAKAVKRARVATGEGAVSPLPVVWRTNGSLDRPGDRVVCAKARRNHDRSSLRRREPVGGGR